MHMLSEEELSLNKKQFSVFGVRSAKTGAGNWQIWFQTANTVPDTVSESDKSS